MENASVEKQLAAGQPPPYQPPIYKDNFAATAGYPTSTPDSQGWPRDPPSYRDGFTAGRPLEGQGQQPSNFQYQPLNNEAVDSSVVDSYGRPFHNQPQTVIIHQPAGAVMWGQAARGPLADPPEDYMCYSIFVTLCCCWLIGIFAILRSSECRAAIAAGDRVTAEIKSRDARSKAHLALVLGIVSTIMTVVVLGVYYGLYFNSLH